VDELRVKREDVRVNFDTTSPLLLQKTAAGQTWQLRTLTRGYLGTVQWEAQLVQAAGGASRTVTKLTVQARVSQRTQGLVTTGVIAKGDVITPSQVTLEERWVDRKVPTWLARSSDVVGFESLRAIAAGSMVDQRDFKPLEMATRGDAVTVYFISAGLKVKSTARALDSGKLHDRIAVRNEATGERYEATVIGSGVLAVGAVDPKTEQQLREAR
jgi:flagella basal body P-ring formation protein FlgA